MLNCTFSNLGISLGKKIAVQNFDGIFPNQYDPGVFHSLFYIVLKKGKRPTFFSQGSCAICSENLPFFVTLKGKFLQAIASKDCL